MARKKNEISFDLQFSSNAESLFDKITKASSVTGKTLEKELSDALNHAQASLKDYADMQKKVLAGSTDITKPVYEQASKVAKASAEFMRVYNNTQYEGNKVTEQLTAPYKALEEEIIKVNGLIAEQSKRKSTAQSRISDIADVKLYEQNRKEIEAVLEQEAKYQKYLEWTNKSLESRKQKLYENNQKYNEWEAHNWKAVQEGTAKNPYKFMDVELDSYVGRFEKSIETVNNKILELRAPYEKIITDYTNALGRLDLDGIKPTSEALLAEVQALNNADMAMAKNREQVTELKQAQDELIKTDGKFAHVGVSPESVIRLRELGSNVIALETLAQQANQPAKEIEKTTKNISKNTKQATALMRGFANAIKHAHGHHSKLHKSSKGLFADTRKGFRQALRNIMRYGIGVRSLYFLFRRLRNATKEAFKIMAQEIPEVNQQVSSLVTNFNLVKANLATMVQPLLKWVVPAFDRLAHAAQTAMEWVGKLFATITGQGYIYRASSAWVDYADSVNGAAKAVNNLLGIDELNVLNNDKGSGSGTFNPENIGYDLVEVSEGIFEKLRKAWENADFTEIGQIIATKFKNALLTVQNNLPGIEDFCNRVALSLATGINGAVDRNINLGYTLGETIAKLIGVGIRSVTLFFDTVNWKDVGTFVAEGINGFVDNINPEDLGNFINAVTEGITTALFTSIKKINWGNLVRVFKDTWNAFSATSKVTLILLPITWALGKMIAGYTGALLTSKLVAAMGGAEAGVASGYGLATGGAYIALAIAGVAIIALSAKLGKLYLDSDFHKNMSTGFEKMIGIDPKETTTGGKHFVVDAVDSFFATVKGVFSGKNLDDSLAYETEQIGQSVWAGFEAGIDMEMNKSPVLSKFSALPLDIKDAYKIHSPSKVFYDIGNYVVQGFLNAFNGFTEKFARVWTGLPNILKSPVNSMITILNRFLQALQTVQNASADMFASLGSGLTSINGPSVNISRWTAPKIPYLAQGAVIPPNSQFLAVLGDQKQGTNIEAPLSTIQEAVANVLEPYLRQIADNTQILTEKDYGTYISDREIAMASARGSSQLGLSLIR